MGKVTGIPWCDHTHNHWIGCTAVSEGCEHCYAKEQNKRFEWVSAWGRGIPRRLTGQANRRKPIQWAIEAEQAGVVRRVFCESLGDVFDNEVPPEWRKDLWQLINASILHSKYEGNHLIAGLEWLLLTKRETNITKMMPPEWIKEPPPHIRVGVIAENQKRANQRIPVLLNAWKGKNFISVEPMIGSIDFSIVAYETYNPMMTYSGYLSRIDWVIIGGESQQGCRHMDIQWARDLRNECAQGNIPCFVKQLGGYPDARKDVTKFPKELQVQEFPRG